MNKNQQQFIDLKKKIVFFIKNWMRWAAVLHKDAFAFEVSAAEHAFVNASNVCFLAEKQPLTNITHSCCQYNWKKNGI